MVRQKRSSIILLTIIALCILSQGKAQNIQCNATFDLDVTHSNFMKPGRSRLICRDAVAVVMHRQNAMFKGVDIFFSPAVRGNAPHKSAKDLQRGNYANLNLMTDASDRVTQVNMTIVEPGRTVARTVAWKAEDLKKFFSQATVTGQRVILKSVGKYDDAETEAEQVTMQWDIDADLPVVDEKIE